MADNRMYLVYKPTGEGIFIGERSDTDWYLPVKNRPIPLAYLLNLLFMRSNQYSVNSEVDLDNYILVFESDDNVEDLGIEDSDGIRVIKFKDR